MDNMDSQHLPRRGRGRPRLVPKSDGDVVEPSPKRQRLNNQAGRSVRATRQGVPHASPFPLFDADRMDADDLELVHNSDPYDQEYKSRPRPRSRMDTQQRNRRQIGRQRSSRRRSTVAPRPRYSSAAAAAAATQASDGYKPREERSWEEFHPDLNIDMELQIYTADEVDGRARPDTKLSNMHSEPTSAVSNTSNADGLGIITTPTTLDNQHDADVSIVEQLLKKRPGRPFRKPESMLSGLGSPPAPRSVPIPTHNPKERLNLPKPSYRIVQTFKKYEEDKRSRNEDYVDEEDKRLRNEDYVGKGMAHLGYQASDRFDLPEISLIRHMEPVYDDEVDITQTLDINGETDKLAHPIGQVEYDMDEQDEKWLEICNASRKNDNLEAIKPSMFEITMTQIEREYYALEKRIPKPNPKHANIIRPRSNSAAAVNGEPWTGGDEPDSKCAICDDGDCENANAIIFCDGCDLAVHQECYGVPFIPEGQWFCRKCKEVGRGVTTCILCPNVEGAFRQTNMLRWAHLLCAIWIPEVTIANPTYMEPIQDIDKIPRNRWGLICYICEQRMGACIQCSNKACFQAFHVTCARRAKLYLKMKATPTSSIDPTIFKAFCDRHVPPEWRRDADTDQAISAAKEYYRKTMRRRRWANQPISPEIDMQNTETVAQQLQGDEMKHDEPQEALQSISNSRKDKEQPKLGSRLPSGAPVIPSIVLHAVESALSKFSLRKRKEFIHEACRYWSLKREARRGAALLKRLQLQLETSSAMEVTRRDFMAMGAAGRPKLERRKEFADLLENDIGNLSRLVENVMTRERLRLEDAEKLEALMNSIYFPLSDLLWPILRKVRKFGDRSRFSLEGLDVIEQKLSQRFYTSVTHFSRDLHVLLQNVIDRPDVDGSGNVEHNPLPETEEIHALEGSHAELRQAKANARRILKTIQEPLTFAMKREAELRIIPLDFKNDRNTREVRSDVRAETNDDNVAVGQQAADATSVTAIDGASSTDTVEKIALVADQNIPERITDVEMSTPTISELNNAELDKMLMPPPPRPLMRLSNPDDVVSETHDSDALTAGGVPWYMQSFDPIGTTVFQEVRLENENDDNDDSDALSEVDEATLYDILNDIGSGFTTPVSAVSQTKVDFPATQPAESTSNKRRNSAVIGATSTRRRAWSGSVNGNLAHETQNRFGPGTLTRRQAATRLETDSVKTRSGMSSRSSSIALFSPISVDESHSRNNRLPTKQLTNGVKAPDRKRRPEVTTKTVEPIRQQGTRERISGRFVRKPAVVKESASGDELAVDVETVAVDENRHTSDQNKSLTGRSSRYRNRSIKG